MKNDPRLEQLIERHELAREYPAEVHAEAAAFVEAPGFDDPSLEDLELLPFVTIDDEDSRDLDQALCLARGDTGGFEVWYALADASHFVSRSGSPALATLLGTLDEGLPVDLLLRGNPAVDLVVGQAELLLDDLPGDLDPVLPLLEVVAWVQVRGEQRPTVVVAHEVGQLGVAGQGEEAAHVEMLLEPLPCLGPNQPLRLVEDLLL
jgi:hypothetical protein